MTKEKTKTERFARLTENFFSRQHELSDKEFRIYSIYSFERWHDSGLVTKTLKSISAQYQINYDSLCRYHANLRRKGWLKDTAEGIVLLVGFTDKLSVTTNQTDQNTDNLSVTTVKTHGNSLTNYQCDTDKLSVTEQKSLINYQFPLNPYTRDLNTQEKSQEEEEGTPPSSGDTTSSRDSDERENRETKQNGTDALGRQSRNANNNTTDKSNNTKDKYTQQLRPDLTTEEWLDWLATLPENAGINVRFLFNKMITKSKSDSSRKRFLIWLEKDREDMPINLSDFEEILNPTEEVQHGERDKRGERITNNKQRAREKYARAIAIQQLQLKS